MIHIRKNIRKKAFTLLEILLCVSLLTLLGGVFAIKGKELFEIYHFRQDVSRVFSCIEFAKHSAFCYQADVEVVFEETSEGLTCRLISDEPTLSGHPFFSQQYLFKTIKGLQGESKKILFSGSGWVFPLSDLELISNTKGKAKIATGARS